MRIRAVVLCDGGELGCHEYAQVVIEIDDSVSPHLVEHVVLPTGWHARAWLRRGARAPATLCPSCWAILYAAITP